MFNPKNFRSPNETSIAIGKSNHPVMDNVVGMYLKRIPSKCELYAGIFYIEVADGKGIVTYRHEHTGGSLQYHKKTLAEFRATVVAKQPLESEYEVVNTDPMNKWLGNDIQLLLKDEGVIA